jgi:hypothetical protein
MDIQSPPTKKQKDREDLATLPLEELEEHFKRVYSSLEKTFETVSGYAQRATQIDAPSQQALAAQTKYFKEACEELDETVGAIIIRAVFSEHNEQKWDALKRGTREVIAFTQAVSSGEDITSEWLAKRDALAAQTAELLKVSPIEEDIREWLNKS